jgi:hypothetical protein
MHLTLTEDNGLRALAEPIMDFPRSRSCTNTTSRLGSSQSLIVTTDECAWFGNPVASIVRPMNRPVAIMGATEEAAILMNPDVTAAVAAALPDLEAWEQTL